MIWNYIAPPLIGAVIGYCTNYIAVKMLFRPRQEIRVFGRRLPLTPGAIPKGKDRLARAVGSAVNERLLTQNDITERLLAPETVDMITDQLMKITDQTVQEAGTMLTGGTDEYESLKNRLSDRLTDDIYTSVEAIPLNEIVMDRGVAIIQQKIAGTMLQMFVTDDLIRSIAQPVGDEMKNYLEENSRDYISREVNEKLVGVEFRTIGELAQEMELEEETLRERIKDLYCGLIRSGSERFLEKMNIAEMIEKKINDMDVRELEDLVLMVMKKELNMIVRLGALIGLILGCLNLLF